MRLTWRGLFQVQFLEAAGRKYMIDINPRIYASLALANAAGRNLAAIWIDLLLGRPPRLEPYRVGIRYRCEELDARALVAAVASGRVGPALRGALPRRKTVHAVFAPSDPLPFLTSLGVLGASLRKLDPTQLRGTPSLRAPTYP